MDSSEKSPGIPLSSQKEIAAKGVCIVVGLTAIWHIDRKLGEELASKYTGDDEFMNRTIELLRKGVI